jgi:diphthamide synthase subunit DPH2
MSTGALLPPSTKGGFSDDGSKIMESTSSATAATAGADGRSLVLSQSALSLDEYYEVPRIIAFLRARAARVCALQFPDDQLSDAVPLCSSLRAAWAAVCPDAVTPSFYVLGDTSYASCCVDEVAAQHVGADAVVHFGAACFTPTRRIPVLHVTGHIPTRARAIDAVASALACPERLAALLPAGSPRRRLLVMYDQRLRRSVPALAAALAARGVETFIGPALVPASTAAPAAPHSAAVVFAEMPSDAPEGQDAVPDPAAPTAAAPAVHAAAAAAAAAAAVSATSAAAAALTEGATTLSLAGFSWPAFPAPKRPPRRRRTLWARGFHPDAWAVCVLVLPLTAADAGAAAAAAAAARAGFAPPSVVDHARAEGLAPRSAALLAHAVLNFASHTVAAVTVPAAAADDVAADAGAVTEEEMVAEVSIEGGGRLARTLGRRLYLIEKAKNAHVFGLVVCTLAAGDYGAAVARAEAVVEDAGRKSYTLCVGKVNEPKLLNFPEIEVFVTITCPVSVLLQEHSATASTDVITPLELEFALGCGRAWTGAYSTDFRDVKPLSGRVGRGRACEEATGCAPDGGACGDESTDEDEDDAAYDGGAEEEGEEAAAAQESAAAAAPAAAPASEGEDAAASDDYEEDDEAPRYSAVDQRYHPRIPRKGEQHKADGAGADANGKTVWGLVEVGSAALVDAGYKPYSRTFTGLDPSTDPAAGTEIRAGLYGTARGYVTNGQEFTDANKQ